MWKHYLETRETDRLFIRPVVMEDEKAWQEFSMNKEATKYFPDDWKVNPAKSKEWIVMQLKRYKENRYGLQALIEKESGSLTGLCGLLTQTVDGKPELEIGYHLIPRFWGKGYATEASMLFKKLAFENKLAKSVISIIDIRNTASQKVAIRNGMTKGPKTTFMGMDCKIFSLPYT